MPVTLKLVALSFLLSLLNVETLLADDSRNKPIDAKATKATKALYHNLRKIDRKHILFGHQHATEYGHGWAGDENRSDVKSVSGSHPAVVGVDFSGLSGRPAEAIEKTKVSLRKQITDTYNRGGVTTVAWHFSNPASKGGVLLGRFRFGTCRFDAYSRWFSPSAIQRHSAYRW